MKVPWRIAILRTACLLALTASAMLTANRLHPERGFCPLEGACDKARDSALGSVLGVPTSVLGMFAFGALFLLTLLPADRARKPLLIAGIVAAASGAGLAGYQAFVLGGFCPLCVVADVAGLVAGAAVIGWHAKTRRLGSKRPPPEFVGARLRWAALAMVAVTVPFFVHGKAKPSYVDLDAEAVLEADPENDAVPPPENDPARARPTLPEPTPPDDSPRADPMDAWNRSKRPEATNPGPAPATPATPPPAPAPTPPPNVLASPAPAAPPAPPSRAPARTTPKYAFVVVEYLNPFCGHCRATHERLERVLTEVPGPVGRRRIYVWASRQPPLWAKALAASAAPGLEDAFFRELVATRDENPASIWAAARRAGLDPDALSAALESPAVAQRLAHDRTLVSNARIAGIPTLDIGRRRLMGEQSESELRDSVHAAAPTR